MTDIPSASGEQLEDNEAVENESTSPASQAERDNEEASQLEVSNNETEQTLREQKEQTEKLPSPTERFRQLLEKYMNVTMQRELGINTYTDVKGFDERTTMQLYRILRRSREYVSSHTPESLGTAFTAEIEMATADLKNELSAQKGKGQDVEVDMNDIASPFTIEDGSAEDYQEKVESVKSVMLHQVESVMVKLEEHAEDSGWMISLKDEYEQLAADNKIPKLVDMTPSDPDLTPMSKNALREFRNSMYAVKTDTGVSYMDSILSEEAPNPEELAKLNAVVDQFNAAQQYCIEAGTTPEEKNNRAEFINRYAKSLTATPVGSPEQMADQSFENWLTKPENITGPVADNEESEVTENE